jgi:hypothetical protein
VIVATDSQVPSNAAYRLTLLPAMDDLVFQDMIQASEWLARQFS